MQKQRASQIYTKSILFTLFFTLLTSGMLYSAEKKEQNAKDFSMESLFNKRTSSARIVHPPGDERNFIQRLFNITPKSKAERSSRSTRHNSSRPERYTPPESSSQNPDNYGRSGRSTTSSSDGSFTSNAPKEPLHTSLRDQHFAIGTWEFGANIGTSHAITDIGGNKELELNDFMSYQAANYDISFGFFVRHKMNTWFGLNFGMDYISLSGQTTMERMNDQDLLGKFFTNDVFEFYGKAEFYIPQLATTPLDVYGFVGAAIFFSDARLFKDLSGDDEVTDLPSEFSQTQPAIPMGFGFNFNAGSNVKIGYEFGWRNTIFHYLDNQKIENANYDSYFLNSLKISYVF